MCSNQLSYVATLNLVNKLFLALNIIRIDILIIESNMVRKERLELSHLAAPEPKSGASTNFAIPALSLYFAIITIA
jgi:hypothetical protein